MSNMPKWLLVLIIGSVSVCLCCGGVGVYATFKIHNIGPNSLTKNVAANVETSLDDNQVTNGMLVIDEGDLIVNTAVAADGETGIIGGTEGFQVAGLTTTISSSGILIASPSGGSTYFTAKPVVQDGKVDMQVPSGDAGLINLFNFDENIFDGLERGINNTLAARGLQATSVTLHDGSLTIETVPR